MAKWFGTDEIRGLVGEITDDPGVCAGAWAGSWRSNSGR